MFKAIQQFFKKEKKVEALSESQKKKVEALPEYQKWRDMIFKEITPEQARDNNGS
jgi:hypothetical protein